MKASELYASPFLKGADLTKPVRVMIDRIQIDTFTDPKTKEESRKIVLHFAGAKKALILNKSNAATCIAAFGDETDLWLNEKWVILSPGQAPNGQPTIVLAAIPEDRPTNAGDNPFA